MEGGGASCRVLAVALLSEGWQQQVKGQRQKQCRAGLGTTASGEVASCH
jgi:hypothetical protein